MKGFLNLSTPSRRQRKLRDPENDCQIIPSERSNPTASRTFRSLIKVFDGVDDDAEDGATDEGMWLFRQLGDERYLYSQVNHS